MWTGSQAHLGHWERGWFKPAPAYLTLFVIRNSCLFPWTNTDSRRTSANWALAPHQRTQLQTFKGALQWLFSFIKPPEKNWKAQKLCTNWGNKGTLAGGKSIPYCQIQEHWASEQGRCQTQPRASDHSLGKGKTVSCKPRYHLNIFKWDVYGAILGMSRSLHDSSTSNCFPSGHGNMT